MIKFQKKIDPWMMRCPNQLLSEMTIPGTHDSCCNVDCGIWQTQNLPLWHQLSLGVRFFDIRCRHVENSFDIYHGYIFCEMTLEDVVNVFRIFLKTFPSECLIVRIKEEFTPLDCSRKFNETYEDYYVKNSDIFVTKNQIPFLDEIRGKIFIIADFDCERENSFTWDQPKIQDCWEINNEKMAKEKLIQIRNHYEASINGEGNIFYLNFLSGTGDYLWPSGIAKMTNQTVFNVKGRLGVVVFDYPDKHSISHCISQNKFFSLRPCLDVESIKKKKLTKKLIYNYIFLMIMTVYLNIY